MGSKFAAVGLVPISDLLRNTLHTLTGWQTIPAAIVALYILAGIFGPWIAPFDPADFYIRDRHSPPWYAATPDVSQFYVLGTDALGRDVLSLLLHGARASLSLVGVSTFIGVVVGTLVTANVSGLRHRARLIAYVALALILVPPALFSVNYPFGLATLYFWDERFWDEQNSSHLANLLALATLATLLTTMIIAFAYHLRTTQPIGRLAKVRLGRYGRLSFRYMSAQFHGLTPWISLSAVSSLLLVFKSAALIRFDRPSISWVSIATDERTYGQAAYWIPHIASTAVWASSICLTVWLAYRCYVSARSGFSASRDRQEPKIDDDGNAANESLDSGKRNLGAFLAAVTSHRLAPIIVLLVAGSLLIARFYYVGDLDPASQNFREPEEDSSSTLESGRLHDCVRAVMSAPGRVDLSTGQTIESHVPDDCVRLYEKYRNRAIALANAPRRVVFGQGTTDHCVAGKCRRALNGIRSPKSLSSIQIVVPGHRGFSGSNRVGACGKV